MTAHNAATAESSLVQRYADLRSRTGGITASVRGMRFNTLLADTLIRDGLDAGSDERGPNGEIDVPFNLDGTWYLLEAKWYDRPITVEPLRHLRDMLTERRPGTIGILASRSGFSASARRRAPGSPNVILFDRPHVEALIAGVTTGPELVAAANRTAAVLGDPDAPLAMLLRPLRRDPEPLKLGAPDGFTPAAVAAPGGVDAVVLAHGPTINGVSAARNRILITVADGVMDLGFRQSAKPQRRLGLTACVGEALMIDDDLLIVRNGGVLQARGDDFTIVAGGFARPPMLFAGPDGAPWLLDRDTSGWPVTEEAAVIEIGSELGPGRRWRTGLPAAAARAACWLSGRTFFILGEGHSAIIDTDTGEHEWIETSVARPQGLVRLSERQVLAIGSDRWVQTAVIDTATRQASVRTAVNLTGHVRGAARIGEEIIVVAGAPVDHATVVPVIARLDLATLTGTAGAAGRQLR